MSDLERRVKDLENLVHQMDLAVSNLCMKELKNIIIEVRGTNIPDELKSKIDKALKDVLEKEGLDFECLRYKWKSFFIPKN